MKQENKVQRPAMLPRAIKGIAKKNPFLVKDIEIHAYVRTSFFVLKSSIPGIYDETAIDGLTDVHDTASHRDRRRLN